MNDLRKQKVTDQIYSIYASLVGVVLGLLFGLIVLIVANPKFALPGFVRLLTSPLTNGSTNIGAVLYYGTTFIICALSVAFAGKWGMFNIGVGGQFIVGSYMVCLIGVRLAHLPPFILVPLALICAILAGALWGAILGALRAIFGISEVVVSIMLNYIGLYTVNMLIQRTIYDSYGNRSMQVGPNAVIPRIGLDKIFPHSGVDLGIVVALILAIVIYYILNKTTFGYEIKLCGYNADAASYVGVNARKNAIMTMAIAGALPAIAGGFWYLSSAGNYMSVVDSIPAAPMTGMSASLLAVGNPIGIIFTGLFVAYITVGGSNLQVFGYVPEIVSIVTGAIIYCSAFVALIRLSIKRFHVKVIRKRKGDAEE
ncbi:ABC transporter permease [Spirochaetia bacterium]|nr:ABC transporter permease [Spirochaetia bacterium]